MKSYILTLGLTVLLAGGLWAQKPESSVGKVAALSTTAAPAEVGLAPERLARLDAACQQLIREHQLPGMVALVARRGQIVYHQAFGFADPQGKRPYRTDDIFRIASMTKAITATAAMLLYEEGKFDLDDPIARWIPEFAQPQVLQSFSWRDTTYTTTPAKGPITVRQLLNHTSGLSYGVISGDERFSAINAKAGIVDLYTTQPVKLADNIKKLATLPLVHSPGEKFTYALGLDVLGYLIEIWSGQPFDQFLRTRLFAPLGMNDTHFYLPERLRERLVPVLRPGKAPGTWERYPTTFYDPEYPIAGAKTWFSGGAGLSSTAKDYAAFLQMLLNGGVYNGQRLLSPYSVYLLTQSNQTGTLYGGPEGDQHFSLAFSVLNARGQDKGWGWKGKFGWGGYFNTNYWADPTEQLILVLMKQTQGAPDGQSEKRITRLVYQALQD